MPEPPAESWLHQSHGHGPGVCPPSCGALTALLRPLPSRVGRPEPTLEVGAHLVRVGEEEDGNGGLQQEHQQQHHEELQARTASLSDQARPGPRARAQRAPGPSWSPASLGGPSPPQGPSRLTPPQSPGFGRGAPTCAPYVYPPPDGQPGGTMPRGPGREGPQATSHRAARGGQCPHRRDQAGEAPTPDYTSCPPGAPPTPAPSEAQPWCPGGAEQGGTACGPCCSCHVTPPEKRADRPGARARGHTALCEAPPCPQGLLDRVGKGDRAWFSPGVLKAVPPQSERRNRGHRPQTQVTHGKGPGQGPRHAAVSPFTPGAQLHPYPLLQGLQALQGHLEHAGHLGELHSRAHLLRPGGGVAHPGKGSSDKGPA